MNLKTKLILVVVPTIFLPLLIMAWIAYVELRDTTSQMTLQAMDTALVRLAHTIRNTLNNDRANIDQFASSPYLNKYLLIEDQRLRYTIFQPKLIQTFLGYQKAYPHYSDIRILLPNGYEDVRITTRQIKNTFKNSSPPRYFESLRQFNGDVYTQLYRHPDNGKTTFLMAKAIKLKDRSVTPHRTPTIRGYFVIFIDLLFLHELVESTGIGETGEIFFSDFDGNILIQRTSSKVGSKFPQHLLANLNSKIRPTESIEVKLNGQPWILRVKKVHPDLVLVTALPQQELFAAGERLGYIAVATLILTAVLVIIAIFTALKFLLIQPVDKLQRAIGEIGKGNLKTPVDIHSNDEIGKLAAAFNMMSTNLVDVQQQVDERTSALSKANRALKLAHNSMAEAKQSAESANEAKSKFLARMSHELRTPLNAILGFAQLLVTDPTNNLSDPHHENVQEIIKAGNHLLNLINEVLDLSRIETGNLEISIENLRLKDTVDAVQSIMEPLAKKHQITLINQIKPAHDICLRADPVRLKQILINLVSNAIKYSQRHRTVTIALKNLGHRWFRIEVVDQGTGLSDEQQKKLFQPFERIDADQTEVEGTGIGLVISRGLVEMMDGRIGVDSTPGLGSTFWIELPASQLVILPPQ